MLMWWQLNQILEDPGNDRPAFAENYVDQNMDRLFGSLFLTEQHLVSLDDELETNIKLDA